MKKNQQDPFDEFLKETLKGHQLVPREEARRAFLKDVSAIKPARGGWFRWYLLPLLFVFISGIVALFVYPWDKTDPVSVSARKEIPPVETEPSPASNTIQPSLTNTDIPTAKPVSVSEKQSIMAENKALAATTTATAASTIATEPLKEKTPALPAALSPAESPVAGIPDSLDTQTTGLIDPTVLQPIDPLTEQAAAVIMPALSDSSQTVQPVALPEDQGPAKELAENAFALGAYYLPEWMFNTVEGGKFVNNFGLDFTFYRGRTSIRTGAGISVSKGITEKAVEYNEFLGTYNKLDSITFVYNESFGDFYPNIHTSSENVWDSLPLYDSTEIIKRYTYLQIPLVLGFDFWQQKRLTVGVRVGTIMSVMLKSEQLTGEYNAGANQVVVINQLSPSQVSMNWQAVGGISGSLMLTRRLFLEIEPQAKYYYQSIYEKSGYEKKPWSLGLRTAILLKF
jgi:hypothetical protein